ncbi:MAG: TonB-dependent receptor [Alphaproteobacteria bacterium]|nr:TonB-dependent receptor [Alphaproteobacteria bacterium]
MSVRIYARLLAVTTALVTAPAMAQIEEIVVTAQKRTESLQNVPLAVTALSADTIEKARIVGLNDIALRTPNFTIGQQNPSEPELTIRGIGSGDREAGSDRSVTVFVDEVYVGRAGASTFDMFDLERVEVLRGPQGTLFGRNVVGGAISLITAKPGPDQLFKGQVSVGTHELIEARAVANQPLSDTAALRVSGSIKERDGYFFNRFLNVDDVGGIKSRNVRAQVSFKPHDDLSVPLSGECAKDKLDGVAARITPGAATPANFAAAMAAFGNYVPPADLFTVESNVKGFQDRDIWATSVRAEFTTENVLVTFIPAYRKTD